MTDLLIERSGQRYDLALDDGEAVLTHTLGRPAEVSQRITCRLLTELGESPYDLRAGVPYRGGVFGNPVPGIVGLLTLEIAETPGVDEVIEPGFDLTSDRELTISGQVRVTDSDELVTLDLLVGG